MIDRGTLWLVVLALGLGTFLIRFSFLGLLGNRPLPAWLARCLRYSAVAILPALVAPAVLWPAATGGQPDPVRLMTVGVTLAAGLLTRSMITAIVAGGAAFYLLPLLITARI